LPFLLRYHPEVKSLDLPRLDAKLKKRIQSAIETRLLTVPHQYGSPLRKTLKGYWKLRVGDYRVVYKITANEVWILAVIHRKKVYEKATRRQDAKTDRRPAKKLSEP
jgi:mRNA interferase RelE/StbE